MTQHLLIEGTRVCGRLQSGDKTMEGKDGVTPAGKKMPSEPNKRCPPPPNKQHSKQTCALVLQLPTRKAIPSCCTSAGARARGPPALAPHRPLLRRTRVILLHRRARGPVPLPHTGPCGCGVFSGSGGSLGLGAVSQPSMQPGATERCSPRVLSEHRPGGL